MRWQGRRQSDNVEDRRGLPGRRLAVGGGLGTMVLVLVVMFLGGDPQALLQQMQPPAGGPAADQAAGPQQVDPAQQPLREFVAVVLADIEDVWNDLFQQQVGEKYREPKLVLYTDQVESACGFGSAAMGPFYCPGDEKVYLDLGFCEEMKTKYQAPGDFAVAYVLAHEVGHHVQKLVGYMELVDKQRGRVSKAEQNQLSVRLELQADYLAGVWAHHAERTKRILESGDVDEALGAASAVGDDRLQKQAQGYVVPDSFTHGTSAQRSKWFRLGLQTGSFEGAKALFELPESQL
ncbi:MAG: zinc metallopeptidase [Candidatus Anammoximicrobium sp.]|nr:zinc metallopeptidase [Candidatus Anammoximicrobium sp.]